MPWGFFCAVGGVEPQSETVWRQADKYAVPRIAFINKMDRIGADFFNAASMIKNRLKANPLILQIPAGSEDSFTGVVDLINMQQITWENEGLGAEFTVSDISPELIAQAEEYREKLLESIAEMNDDIMEKYLSEEDISVEELTQAIRKSTISRQIVSGYVRQCSKKTKAFSPC